MYVIFYTKATSEIVGFREDLSSPPMSESQIASLYLSDHGISDGSVGHAVLNDTKLTQFDVAKYLYNESTNSAIENPNYVPPAPEPEPTTEPTV